MDGLRHMSPDKLLDQLKERLIEALWVRKVTTKRWNHITRFDYRICWGETGSNHD